MAKHILVVDDTSLLVSLTNTLLAGSVLGSPMIDLASSPATALDLLKKNAYDLLLVNYQTENCDSMEVLRQLREADYQTEAVVVAGWITPALLARGHRLGVERFYRLPAELNDFTTHLRFA